MNQTPAVIVQAANVRGAYLYGKYYYGVEDCCECGTKLKQLVHAHFLLSNSDCLTSTACVKYPYTSEIKAIMNTPDSTSNDCVLTITVVTPTACGDLTIEKIPR